jgi:hypothetical protein
MDLEKKVGCYKLTHDSLWASAGSYTPDDLKGLGLWSSLYSVVYSNGRVRSLHYLEPLPETTLHPLSVDALSTACLTLGTSRAGTIILGEVDP